MNLFKPVHSVGVITLHLKISAIQRVIISVKKHATYLSDGLFSCK